MTETQQHIQMSVDNESAAQASCVPNEDASACVTGVADVLKNADVVESEQPSEAQVSEDSSQNACASDKPAQDFDSSGGSAQDAQPSGSRAKRWLKYIGFGALFCVVLAVLLIPVSYVLHPKNNSKEAGMEDERTYAILAEPANTIDAVFVGNSVLSTSVSPMEIWEKEGYTTFVCAANGEQMSFVHYMLEQVFEKQSPSIVFLETDLLFTSVDVSHITREIVRQTYPGLLYHHRWCSLTIDDFTQPIEYTNVLFAKGYNAKARQDAALNQDYVKPTDEATTLGTLNRLFLDDAIKLCEEHGARLVFLSTPTTQGWSYQHHNATEALAQEYGLDYLEMNIGSYSPNIDWNTETRDRGNHLNYRGATKTTGKISYYLQQAGLVDHRGDTQYDAWNDCLVQYHNYMKELIKNPEQYDMAGTDVQ